MMAMVETLAQQTVAANRTLKEANVDFNSKLAELERENQTLKKIQRAAFDPFNPEMEENELLEEEEQRQEVEQPRQRTLVLVHRLLEEVALTCSEGHLSQRKS